MKKKAGPVPQTYMFRGKMRTVRQCLDLAHPSVGADLMRQRLKNLEVGKIEEKDVLKAPGNSRPNYGKYVHYDPDKNSEVQRLLDSIPNPTEFEKKNTEASGSSMRTKCFIDHSLVLGRCDYGKS